MNLIGNGRVFFGFSFFLRTSRIVKVSFLENTPSGNRACQASLVAVVLIWGNSTSGSRAFQAIARLEVSVILLDFATALWCIYQVGIQYHTNDRLIICIGILDTIT